MSWKYQQSTGRLSHNGKFVEQGYSGITLYRNKPFFESVKDKGPIPAGQYLMEGGHSMGKMHHVIWLIPKGHNAHNRVVLRIHGDNKKHDASTGCVIISLATRIQIETSGETTLEVVW